MAKISLSKLTPVKKVEPKTIVIAEQEIVVEQYLPVQEKMAMLENVLNHTIDETGFFNPTRLEVFFIIYLIKTYTNISITDKMIEEAHKTYDLLEMNGITDAIVEAIPDTEYETLYEAVEITSQHVSEHITSFAGTMKTVLADYSATKMDVDAISRALSDPEQVGLVKDVLDKLG